jgi:flagellar biosynthesis protein FlhG
MVELSPVQHAELIRAFSEMKTQVDVLLVDTAAGISDMLSFTRAAQDIMVVVCDEPTSITDAYALIKILWRSTVCSASRWWPTWSAPCARGRSCSPS